MKSVFFLAALVAPIIALAKPGDSALAEVVRRQPGPNLLARSGIATSSISKECQSQCSPVITTLDACKIVASCECTQANFDSLGTCMNCLQALAPQYHGLAPADVYGGDFEDACAGFGFVLNDISVTATPTGIASTGDPFSIFEPATPTAGATKAVTAGDEPLLPTQATSSGKMGGAVGLNALQSLNAGVVGAVAAAAIFMGALPL
ncbi:hypothetical protein V8E53_008667 [Lactarius tabidus]